MVEIQSRIYLPKLATSSKSRFDSSRPGLTNKMLFLLVCALLCVMVTVHEGLIVQYNCVFWCAKIR